MTSQRRQTKRIHLTVTRSNPLEDLVLRRTRFQAAARLLRSPVAAICVDDTHGRTCLDMAKTYRRSVGTRVINAVFRAMTSLGMGASYRYVLEVPGRKTGRLYSTPVDVITVDGERWLVAGYGPANWVRNVRVAGEATLNRGRRSQRFKVEEAGVTEAVPVLRKYISEIRVTRPYFDATQHSADDDLAAEVPRHPVFRLTLAMNRGPER